MTKQYEIRLTLPESMTRSHITAYMHVVLDELGSRGVAVAGKVCEVRPGKLLVEDIVRWAQQHQAEHPDHGINCVCADEMIRQVRQASAVPGADQRTLGSKDPAWTAQQRVDWIINLGMRNRY